MLTEKDAWILLAGCWAETTSVHGAVVHWHIAGGLCHSLTALLAERFITVETYRKMRGKLQDYAEAHEIESLFYWPRDAAGARERSLFCSRQAENL